MLFKQDEPLNFPYRFGDVDFRNLGGFLARGKGKEWERGVRRAQILTSAVVHNVRALIDMATTVKMQLEAIMGFLGRDEAKEFLRTVAFYNDMPALHVIFEWHESAKSIMNDIEELLKEIEAEQPQRGIDIEQLRPEERREDITRPPRWWTEAGLTKIIRNLLKKQLRKKYRH